MSVPSVPTGARVLPWKKISQHPLRLRASRPLSRQSVTVRASFNKGPKIDVADRVIAALPYLLPLLDGLKYSKFFWRVAPQAKILILPLQPLVEIFYGVPFASFIAFMAVVRHVKRLRNLV